MEVSKEKQITRLVDKLLVQLCVVSNKINISTASGLGDSWSSNVYRAEISGYNNLNEPIRLALFIKLAPTDVAYREFCHIPSLFQKEIYFYTKVIPELISIQKEKKIAKLFAPFSKYYISSLNFMDEGFVVEDLKAKKFFLGKYRRSVDYSSGLLAMECLGRLHALSFALKKDKPDVFNQLRFYLKDNIYSVPEVFETAVKLVSNLSNQILLSYKDASIKKAVQKFAVNFPSFYTGTELFQGTSMYDVICHGDFTLRNIMYKYGDGPMFETPEECCLVDLQLSRVTSPAYDLLYFLFACTDKNFRQLHYKNMIHEYYKSFCVFLKKLGGDPEKSLPLKVLEQHLKKYAPFGLYITMLMISLQCKSEKEDADQDELSEELFTIDLTEMQVFIKSLTSRTVQTELEGKNTTQPYTSFPDKEMDAETRGSKRKTAATRTLSNQSSIGSHDEDIVREAKQGKRPKG